MRPPHTSAAAAAAERIIGDTRTSRAVCDAYEAAMRGGARKSAPAPAPDGRTWWLVTFPAGSERAAAVTVLARDRDEAIDRALAAGNVPGDCREYVIECMGSARPLYDGLAVSTDAPH